jgi:serine/threonine protein kinase
MSQNNSTNFSDLSDTGSRQDSTHITVGPPTVDRNIAPVYLSDTRLKPGDTVSDSYEIIELLGSGGMGSVFKVRHKILQKIYAMKTLSSEQVNQTAWRRLQVEAQAIARMNHPNIIGIHNFGLHEERLPFYVMDLLIGDDLADRLAKRGPLSVEQAISIFIEVAHGLAYAHKKGIVHRDIKPGNIILLETPDVTGARVKLVDFGIAKLSGIKDPDKQKLTSIGEIFGSPYYMSPEQCTGTRIDTRCDIYSVGCTLFEALTGMPPFKGSNPVNTMIMHQTMPPPTLKKASGGKSFPEPLEQLVAKLLEKAPMDRYQSMDKVAEDLAMIERGEEIGEVLFNTQKLSSSRNSALRLNGTDLQKEETKPEEHKQIIVLSCLVASIALLMVGAIFWHWYSADTKPTTVVSLQSNLITSHAPAEQTSAAKAKPTAAKSTAGEANLNASSSSSSNINTTVSDTGDPDSIQSGQEAQTKPSANASAESRAGSNILPLPENSAAGTSSLDAALSAKGNLEPFSRIVYKNGRKMREFNFPEQSLGFIGAGQSKTDRLPANRKLLLPYDEPLYFYTLPYMMSNMDFFRRFRPDDIYYIHLCEGAMTSAALSEGDYLSMLSCIKTSNVKDALDIMGSWTNLRSLAIERNPNADKSIFSALNKLTGLKVLQINRCSISGTTLGKLSYLRSLEKLECRDCPQVSDLISAISGSDNLKTLVLEAGKGERLSLKDCRNIAACKNLLNLTLCNCKLDDQAVAILSSLPKVKVLVLSGGKFSSASVKPLAAMKSLRQVYFDDGEWMEDNQKQLEKANPSVVKIRDMPPGI